ncbi:uncharacterized protein LOC134184681 [Corticium candelabrum]|uniref:uncharacterized protein LOC134184681 n=1 Tax=Corticium candelabrum TaxID=121492 RepID=UPI002E30AA30|nr:uncharacterized protein LOC134184681 [Corticium candelabrum]
MEFLKLTEASPSIRGAQLLKELFQQSARREWDEKLVPYQVWENTGHLYVSLHQGKALLSFDVVPQGQRNVDSRGVLEALRFGRVRPQVGSGSLLYICSGSPIINICFLGSDHTVLYLVHANGEVHLWKFKRPGYVWKQQATFHLASGSNVIVTSVILCSSLEHSFVWCEERFDGEAERWMVCVRPLSSDSTVNTKDDETIRLWNSVGPATVVVHNCPSMSLYTLKTGVWLMPCRWPAPKNLSMFYSFQSKSLKTFVWGHGHPAVNSTFSSAPDFKVVASRLACLWTKSKSNADLLALCTHSMTHQLIGVGSDGSLYELYSDEGVPVASHICQLSSFIDAAVDCSSVVDLSHRNTGVFLCLFLFRTFALIQFPGGLLRLYLCSTGSLLWQSERLSGSSLRLWTSHGLGSSIGVWTLNGIHRLQSKPIIEQAQLISSGRIMYDEQNVTLQESTTDVDCDLTQNLVAAARYCKLWGLKPWTEKFILDALHTEVKNKTEGQQRLNSELAELLNFDCLHSPALLMALLTHFPGHRHEIVHKVKTFLTEYDAQGDGSQRAVAAEYHQTVSKQQLIGSALNDEIVPLLRDYVSLHDQVHLLLSDTSVAKQEWSSPLFLSVNKQVTEILEKTFAVDQSSSLQDQTDFSDRLDSLALDSPCEVLDAILDFLELSDMKKAIDEITNQSWQSRHDWKNILMPLDRSYQDSNVTTSIPLFEIMCRLFYNERPDSLALFVNFCQLARDYNAKSEPFFARSSREHYFFKRALDSLPPCVSVDTTPMSLETMKARVQLMVRSGQSHMEVESLRLYLRCRLWSSALELAKQFADQSVTHYEMFHALLNAFLEARVFKLFQAQLLSLMPKEFRLQDFLSILDVHILKSSCDIVVAQDDDFVTVGDLLPFLTLLAET